MARIVFAFIISLTLSIGCYAKRPHSDVYFGGGIGIAQPTNLGANDELGYKDVASTGFHMQMQSQWFYAKTLSIGGEISYTATPQNDEYWDLGNYGKATNYYRTMGFTAIGHYYFSHDEFRPYAGIGFGAWYLMNQLDFVSNYTGTANDASVSYHTKDWKPGFAPEAGFLFEMNKKSFFYFNIRLQLIPNLKPTIVELTDEYGYVYGTITQNPHGHQNHFLLVAGLLF